MYIKIPIILNDPFEYFEIPIVMNELFERYVRWNMNEKIKKKNKDSVGAKHETLLKNKV